MRTRSLLLAVAALLLIVIACEPPRSKNPLSDLATAKPDPRLSGTWAGRMSGDDEATLTFIPRGGALVDLVLVGDDGPKGAVVVAFEAYPSVIAGKSYLNLRQKTFSGDYSGTVTVADTFIFARYEIGKDGLLTLSIMQDEPVQAAIAAKKLDGTADGGATALTASSEKLAAFVAATDPAKLFERTASFKRAKFDFPPKAPVAPTHR